MTDLRCPSPIGFADVVDYWAGELTRSEEDRIEEHVFGCADCARSSRQPTRWPAASPPWP